MGELLQALILGIVQGLTEFVPVSSSGHLVLMPWLLGWQKLDLVFDTTVHLGTLAALLVYFRREVWEVSLAWLGGWRDRSWKDPAARMGWLIIVGTMPAAVLGLLFKDGFESLFAQPNLAAAALLVTGLILAFSERMSRRQSDMAAVTVAMALLIGLAQVAAMVPGISRSGATIAAGLALGLTRPASARYSFLLAMPIIAFAGMSQLVEVALDGDQSTNWMMLSMGFLTAAVSGYLCIKLLLAYLQRGTLYVFAVYCWLMGLTSLAVWFLA
jgi:undecaprenyl-diphosphatase